jgi:hypothetical protein
MEKVQALYTPIQATITPTGGALNPGDSVTIDTNVPATVVYTIDGSEPRLGSFGAVRTDAPVSIQLRTPARVRFKAFDNRVGRALNATKTQEASFAMTRRNPLEAFRDTAHFYRRLTKIMVDQNFYLTEGNWLVPVSSLAYTYVFVNRESFAVRLRVLHNGIDVFSQPPLVGAGQVAEVPIRPISGDNTIEVQTIRGSHTALYDIGGYDIDTYA